MFSRNGQMTLATGRPSAAVITANFNKAPHAVLICASCHCCRCMQAQKEEPAKECAAFLDWIARLVDDMAALLSASVLQLLGGCRGVAMAWAALQAGGASLIECHCAMHVTSWETAAEAQVSGQTRHCWHVLTSLHRA
jgi:hypothetical protein